MKLCQDTENRVEEMAAALGLRRVGWIFTDLVPDSRQANSVKHFRNVDTHFLSAQERHRRRRVARLDDMLKS